MRARSPLLHICIFASGSGTNAEAIIQAAAAGQLCVSVPLIVTDRPKAGVLERAKEHNIPCSVISPSAFESATEYAQALLALLTDHGIDFIALAGYLKKIPDLIVDRYLGHMTNIHPSLLPSFGGPGMYGIHVHKAVIERGVRWTGATVHFVDHHYDTGPIILQKVVPVHQNDTPQLLAERVLAVEHQLYPEALRLISEGRVIIENNRVVINPIIPH